LKKAIDNTKYYIVNLYADNPINIDEKKKFLWSVFGIINKFNNAIGYKNEIENCPNRILFDKMRTPYEGNIIAEFYIPIKKQKTFPNNKTVLGVKLAESWVNFLRKVYPTLKVSLDIGICNKISLVDFATQFFMSSVERENRCTIEFSADAYFTNEDKSLILSKIQKLSNYKLSIHQEYCETCEEYNPGNSIHTELEYEI